MKSDPQYYTQNDLKERGWNKTIIAALLGEPDKLKPNPWYRSSPPVRLFLITRVKELEESAAFKSHTVKRAKRSLAAVKAVETKKALMLTLIKNINIRIPELSPDELVMRAVRNYNVHHADRGRLENYTTVQALASWDNLDSFRDRICVNYLRHNCTQYDSILHYLTSRIGREDAHRLLFQRIIERIAGCYPQLADEARRQLVHRFGVLEKEVDLKK
jgi:hypothetical protein